MAKLTVHVDGKAFDVEDDDPATSWQATIKAGTKEAARKIGAHLDALQRPKCMSHTLHRSDASMTTAVHRVAVNPYDHPIFTTPLAPPRSRGNNILR